VYNVQVRRRITLEVAHPFALFAGVLVAVVAVDQGVKALVRAAMTPGESIALVDGILHLTYVRNTGAAFGLMPGQRVLFVTTGLVVALGSVTYMLWVRPRVGWLVTSMAFVASGALGNLVDRTVDGRVTDFIDVFGQFFPVFNIADSAIVVGVAMLVIWVLFAPEPAEPPAGETDSPESSEESVGP